MKLGFLSDAHGNPDGLVAALEALHAANVAAIYFLGDAVGYLPGEAEVLAELDAVGATALSGNHEAMLLGREPLDPTRDEVYRLGEVAARLPHVERDRIATWPAQRDLQVGDVKLLLVHGSPWEPLTGYVYPDGDLARFASLPYDVVLCGHTHRPFQRRVGSVEVVNVGSCGMPRDVGDLASYAIFDTESRVAAIGRVRFDAERVIARYAPRLHPSVIACLRRRPPDIIAPEG